MSSSVAVSVNESGQGTQIDLSTDRRTAPSRLAGLTVYVDDPARCRATVDGGDPVPLTRNAADQTGRPSVSIPWTTLEYPEL
jgi:hypothetical protein